MYADDLLHLLTYIFQKDYGVPVCLKAAGDVLPARGMDAASNAQIAALSPISRPRGTARRKPESRCTHLPFKLRMARRLPTKLCRSWTAPSSPPASGKPTCPHPTNLEPVGRELGMFIIRLESRKSRELSDLSDEELRAKGKAYATIDKSRVAAD